MSERYWISGVQIGILTAAIAQKQYSELEPILRTVVADQFVGKIKAGQTVTIVNVRPCANCGSQMEFLNSGATMQEPCYHCWGCGREEPLTHKKQTKDTVAMGLDVKFAQGFLHAQKDQVCQNYANRLSWAVDFLVKIGGK